MRVPAACHFGSHTVRSSTEVSSRNAKALALESAGLPAAKGEARRIALEVPIVRMAPGADCRNLDWSAGLAACLVVAAGLATKSGSSDRPLIYGGLFIGPC